MRSRPVGALLVGVTVASALTAAALGASASAAVPPVSASTAATAVGSVTASVPAPAGVRARAFVAPLRVPDPAGYVKAKEEANAAASRIASTPAGLMPLVPATTRSWQGINDTAHAPTDSTGAVGSSRYIEWVNSDYAIYSKTSTTPLFRGPLTNITGCVPGFGCADSVFDPQMIWDPGTNRFFYVADDVIDSSHNFFAFGWSTTATPNSTSWCRYNLAFGANFPDFPKLGDTQDFQLVGSNIFNAAGNYSGSDITWISKPGAGTSCPAGSALKVGTVVGLKNANGTQAFTPVPANQTDTSGTGWAVARPATLPATGGTFLTVFKITKNATTGAAVIPLSGAGVPVAAYKVPAAAPQLGSANKLDTSDARNTQAVSAIDPSHGSQVALWTQHTVFGGAGAQVRWYEINPASHTLFQQGVVSSPSLFTFNGAISPDRAVNGTSVRFGANMVVDVNTTSSVTKSTVKLVSKIGTAAQSAPVLVATSSGPDIGFDCVHDAGVCRWGDYAAATPDPTPPAGATGLVWGTSMLTFQSSDTSSSNGATWNFAAKP